MESFYDNAIPTGIQYTGGGYTLGQQFSVTTDGEITGIKFYKTAAMGNTHTGGIYDSFGNLLASVSFSFNLFNGWQTATFSDPLIVNANTPYILAVNFPDGVYLQQDGFLGLTNLDIVVPNPSGMWTLGSGLALPVAGPSTYGFAIDLLFDAGVTPPSPIPLASSATSQSKLTNTIDSGSIAAISAAIRQAVSNGEFNTDLYYYWNNNEATHAKSLLETLGYKATGSSDGDHVWKLNITWPKK